MNLEELKIQIKQEKEKGNKFYIYMICFPDTENPYYIGKGSSNRVFKHLSMAKNIKNKKSLHNYIRKFGAKIFIDSFHNDEGNAFLREIELIEQYGRKETKEGKLVNRTEGGEGNSGIIVEDATRKLLSKIIKEKWKNPSFREKVCSLISKSLTKETQEKRLSSYQKYLNDPIWKKSFSKKMKEVTNTKKYKNKMSESVKLSWTEERKEEYSEKMKDIFLDNTDRKEKLINGNIKSWEDKNKKEVRIKKIKKALSTKEWKEKQAENTIKSWENSEIREKRLNNLKLKMETIEYKKVQSDKTKLLWGKRNVIMERCKSLISENFLNVELLKIHSSIKTLLNFEKTLLNLINMVPYNSNVISKPLEFRENPNVKTRIILIEDSVMNNEQRLKR